MFFKFFPRFSERFLSLVIGISSNLPCRISNTLSSTTCLLSISFISDLFLEHLVYQIKTYDTSKQFIFTNIIPFTYQILAIIR